MADYRTLPWDSDLFGFTVAAISNPDLDIEQLRGLVSRLRQSGVRLAYWPAARRIDGDRGGDLDHLGGLLVDQKTTFLAELAGAVKAEFKSNVVIECYHSAMPYEPLRALVVQSGEFSRFAVDPNVPRDKFVEMYTTWLDRSLAREMASEVLVACQDDSPVGFVTLGSVADRGDIGLIAVDKECRGRGYGEALVRSAQRWFRDEGFAYGQVVTQRANEQACSLYQKCGYLIEKVEYYYHLWL